MRSAYRVAVAATDEIERDQLSAPAQLLGLPDGDGRSLFEHIEAQLGRAAALVDRLSAI